MPTTLIVQMIAAICLPKGNGLLEDRVLKCFDYYANCSTVDYRGKLLIKDNQNCHNLELRYLKADKFKEYVL